MRNIIFTILYYLIWFNAVFAQETKQDTVYQMSWKALTDKGIKLYQKGNYQATIEAFEKAKTYAVIECGIQHIDYVETLGFLAMLYDRQGLYTKAEPLYVEAIALIVKALGFRSADHVTFLNSLARLYDRQGLYAKAEPLYIESKDICAGVFGTKHSNYAIALNNLAELYLRQGLYTKAEPLYMEAKRIIAEGLGKKHHNYALILNNLAGFYDDQGLYTKAEPLYLEAMNIWAEALGKKHLNYATSLNNLAELYKTQGLYAKAEPLYLEAMSIWAELGTQHPDYALALNNLARLYESQGLYAKAESLYIESKNIREKVFGTQHPDYALALNNLAGLYEIQGLYAKAESLYIESKNIREKAFGTKHPSYAIALSNLAGLYRVQGLYTKAESLYIESKNIWEKAFGTKHPSYAIALNNLAELYRKQGLYTKTEPLYLESKDIREEVFGTQHPDYAVSLNNLAGLYYKQGLYAQAEPLYLEAKEIWREIFGAKHPSYATALNNLAGLYKSKGLYTKAESLYLEAKNIRREIFGTQHPDYAASLNDIANLYSIQHKYAQAEPLYQEASQILLHQTKTNFIHLSEKEKEYFLKTFDFNFEAYKSFTLKAQAQIPSLSAWIYDIALATKGLLLQSTQKMRMRILNSEDETLKQQFKSWQIKRNSLARAYNLSIAERKKRNINIQELETEANTIEKELSLKSQNFTQIVDETYYTWQDIQQKLKPSEAAIEIIRTRYYDNKQTDSVLYIALMVKSDTKDQPEMVVLPTGNELEKKYLSYYRNQIQGSDKLSYEQYWQPIAEKLKGIRKVYFSLDGVYHQINLNTLKNPKTGRYILEEIDIHLLGSTRDLVKQEFTGKDFTPGESVILGYPLYDLDVQTHQDIVKSGAQATRRAGYETQVYFTIGEELADLNFPLLEGSKLETQNIHQLFKSKGLKSALYQDKNALEEVVKQVRSPKVLHIATHGFFFEKLHQKITQDTTQQNLQEDGDLDYDMDETASVTKENIQKPKRNPMMSSGLVFTGVSTYAKHKQNYDAKVNTEDGILTAYEAQNLNLDNTELVVLSACQTGQGDVQSGEGVYGLQRGFQVAGAKTIIMSLWNVSDNVTQELMTTFYKLWLSGKNKRKAFRLAQKKIKKKYNLPYYWGAFVMVGR